MYLPSFFQSLEMLRKPELFEGFPHPPAAEKNIYYGYERSRSGGKEVCLLYYFSCNSPALVKTIDVTEHWQYMESLNREPIDILNAIAADDLPRALVEACALYDAVICMEPSLIHVHSMAFTGVMRQVCLNEHSPNEEEPLLLFSNNIFLRDLAFTQFKYFVKMYVKHSPYYDAKKQREDVRSQFEAALKAALRELDIYTLACHPEIVRQNAELDDFITQLDNY